MFTFHWQYICGASWVAGSGAVIADGIDDARAQILARNRRTDEHVGDWTEKTENGITRYIIPMTYGLKTAGERIEFWQEPSLFDFN